MKTKHTPGPWTIDDSMAKDKYSSVLWYIIKDSVGTKLSEVKGIHCGVNNDEAEANANVMAAAPELLEALDGLLSIIDDTEGVHGYHSNGNVALWDEFNEVDIAIQAIKKATS